MPWIIVVRTAVPSTIAASTTCPSPVARACTSAASAPSARNIPPPPKSPSRLIGGAARTPPIDADDVGAEIGEQHPAERPRAEPGELHHPDALQRSHARSLPSRRPRACDPVPGMVPDVPTTGQERSGEVAYLLAAL